MGDGSSYFHQTFFPEKQPVWWFLRETSELIQCTRHKTEYELATEHHFLLFGVVLLSPVYFFGSFLDNRVWSRQPFPPYQCPDFSAPLMSSFLHLRQFVSYGCSLHYPNNYQLHSPQIITSALSQSCLSVFSSWQRSHGKALPQHANLSHRKLNLQCRQAPLFGSSESSLNLIPPTSFCFSSFGLWRSCWGSSGWSTNSPQYWTKYQRKQSKHLTIFLTPLRLSWSLIITFQHTQLTFQRTAPTSSILALIHPTSAIRPLLFLSIICLFVYTVMGCLHLLHFMRDISINDRRPLALMM